MRPIVIHSVCYHGYTLPSPPLVQTRTPFSPATKGSQHIWEQCVAGREQLRVDTRLRLTVFEERRYIGSVF